MGYIFSLFLLPAGWNMDVLGGAWAAILDPDRNHVLRMAEYQNKKELVT